MAELIHITDIRFFNLLKTKFSEKEAEEFVSLVKEQVEQSFDNKKDSLASRADIAALDAKIDIKIAQLETTIAKTESKLLLWAFVFWATQLGAIFAFIKFFIK